MVKVSSSEGLSLEWVMSVVVEPLVGGSSRSESVVSSSSSTRRCLRLVLVDRGLRVVEGGVGAEAVLVDELVVVVSVWLPGGGLVGLVRRLVLDGEGGCGLGGGVWLVSSSSLAKAANRLEDWVAGVLSPTVSSSELVGWRWRLVADWREDASVWVEVVEGEVAGMVVGGGVGGVRWRL